MSGQPTTLPALPPDGITTAVPPPEPPASLIVRGPRKAVAAARVITRVAWLGMSRERIREEYRRLADAVAALATV